jgi:hypothetical protein
MTSTIKQLLKVLLCLYPTFVVPRYYVLFHGTFGLVMRATAGLDVPVEYPIFIPHQRSLDSIAGSMMDTECCCNLGAYACLGIITTCPSRQFATYVP